jgi:DNA-directed RNA polymerase beta' subunit
VYFIGQSEVHEDGREHFRTVGKMLDSMVCIEGLSTIVLKSVVKDGRYCFSTKNNGFDTVKTPLGMFSAEEEFIDKRELLGDSFTAGMGAEAIKTLLENINLDELAAELREKMIEKVQKAINNF